MQIIIKNLRVIDIIYNFFYKIRYGFYRKFTINKLKSISKLHKEGYIATFVDDFEEISWGNEQNKNWIVGEVFGSFHPDYTKSYYGPPSLLPKVNNGIFSVKYNPKEFIHPNTKEKIIIPFEVSRISTQKSFRQSYGRFECRCTLPQEKGVWPAFWLWGSTWPPEIDIFETYGGEKGKTNNIIEMNLHYGFIKDKTKSHMKARGIRVDDDKYMVDTFHEYAVEWTSNKIEFFIDSVKVFRYTRKDVLNKYFNTSNANMWIEVNHSIQDDIVSENETDYYSEFRVDYVRAYKIKKGDN